MCKAQGNRKYSKDFDCFVQKATELGTVELTAVLLDYQVHSLTMKKVEQARERKEKTHEKQMDTIIANQAWVPDVLYATYED